MMKYGPKYIPADESRGSRMTDLDPISSLQRYIARIQAYQGSYHPTFVLLRELKHLLITMEHNLSESAEDNVCMWLECLEGDKQGDDPNDDDE
jgi:hypothetical protein